MKKQQLFRRHYIYIDNTIDRSIEEDDTYKEVLDYIDKIEDDEEESSQRDRGALFELLTKVYLEIELMYRQLFDSVWLFLCDLFEGIIL